MDCWTRTRIVKNQFFTPVQIFSVTGTPDYPHKLQLLREHGLVTLEMQDSAPTPLQTVPLLVWKETVLT